MGIIEFDRLKKLADHLSKGELGHERFYFGFFNAGWFLDPIRQAVCLKSERLKNCGAAGCALGECPFLFDEWYFDAQSFPVTKQGVGSMRSASIFFGLDVHQAAHLFCPYEKGTGSGHLADNGLTKSSTRYEVADQIYKFIKDENK